MCRCIACLLEWIPWQCTEATITVKPHHTIEQLYSLYRTETNARMARRIHGVWLASKGLTCPKIMAITGSARRAVQQWVAKYNDGRIEALHDRPRSGAPQLLPHHREAELRQRIDAGPTAADHVSVFTAPVIRWILEQEFNVVYSVSAVKYLLHRLGFSYLCPRPVHEKSDPAAQQAFKKISRAGWLKSPPGIPASQ